MKFNLLGNLKLIAFSIAFLAIYHAYGSYQAYEAKINQQNSINHNVEQIKATWNGLQPTIDKWSSMYFPASEITSLYHLNKTMGIDNIVATANSTKMFEVGANAVLFENQEIGLISRCVKNASTGFVMSTDSLEQALSIVSYIERRPDLEWSQLTLSREDSGVNTTLSQLCVHLIVVEGE